ncbi:ABC transporter substrate-binding protein [Acidisoma silvae]|uniref:ABC transporter substrate-binding protein n=1 Tax=Acidisoma silvae TaxID=2802396 RepID=A0A963YWZ6_9PROT|nr:ABC transporter substrate-binding protein [Acidisoma silvae]MCB8877703.1 ABC transporter substrate-binding protein [Acidisoma silvae]
MLTRRTMLTTTAGTAAAIGLMPPGAASAWAKTPKNMVVMAKQIDDMVSLDPAESYEFTDNEVDANCYSKLIVPDTADPSKLVGDLAQSWDVSPDGLTVTFHLKSDKLFASGKAVTAEDAAYSLQRVIKLNKAPAFVIGQFGFTPDNVDSLITATDAHTLVVKLPALQATSFLLYCLSANVGGIVEKAVAEAHATNGDFGNAWLKTNSAGSGPYSLVSWVASDHIILNINPHFTPAPQMKRVAIRHVADPSAQLLLVQKGDVDIARDLTSDQLKSISGDKALHLISANQAAQMYIAMNEAVPQLAKPEVRQAIKWALGYDAIAQNITPDTWGVSQSFLPKGLPGTLNETPFKKDVTKAKALMAQAGLSGGFSVTMDYISHAPYSDIAQAIQADLAGIGIKLTLVPGEEKQVITKTRARTHQLALLEWFPDYFDPNSNAQGFCYDPDDTDASKVRVPAWRSHFADKTLSADVLAASKETDNAKRMAIYADMQHRFWDIAPFAFVLQKNDVATLRTGVNGLSLGALPDFTSYKGITKS